MPIYEKLNAIREDALKFDWTPDKAFPKGGKTIQFVSGEKIKRQFAPLWVKHKVDLDVEVTDYQIHSDLSSKQYSQTLSIKVRFILTDAEDGSKTESTVVGFAPADDLHGPKTALSFAYNTFMTTKFQICDKLEDVIEDVEQNVMNRLSQMSVPEVIETPAPIQETKQDKVNRAVREKFKKEPTEEPSAVNLTVAEQKARENSLEQATKWYENGDIVESQYAEIKKAYDSVKNFQDVSNLMKMIRTIKNDINKGKTEAGF